MSPDDSKNITECSGLLAIPDHLSDRNAAIRMQCLPKEGHEAVEAKEQRSRALKSSIRPVALGLDAQLSSAFLKSGFQTPALHEIPDDLFYCLGRIRGKERFWGTLA